MVARVLPFFSGVTTRASVSGILRRMTELPEIQLEAMTYGGDAIGRSGGKAIFVQGGIAGERVRVEVIEDRGRYARARVVDVVERSPCRAQPRCPHFGFDSSACGGCQWQHIDYAAQVRFKTEIVREQLRRIGRIAGPPVRDTLPSPDAWAYRNNAQFGAAPGGRPGFQAARSNRIVPIRECYVIRPELAAWLGKGRRLSGKRIEVRCGNANGGAVTGPVSCFQVKHARFRVSAGSFFQVNTSLIETLVDEVLRRLDAQSDEAVLDAYCGVGLFTRFIALQARRVIGVESGAGAIADARANLAQFGNVDLRKGLVETAISEMRDPIDAAVVDPPRAGCGPKVVSALIGKPVKRLVYVSCDPSTLARDARQLLDGGYRLTDVQPLDMFPQTYHIETISLFKRET